MTNDEFRSWAMKALEKEIVRSMPAAKARRALQATQRESKKESLKLRRSLATQQASRMRILKRQQAESEDAMRRRWAEIDAAAEQKRWDFLLKQ